MIEKVHYQVIVTGKVQGVGYRYSALRKAQMLGINGYVKNQANGTVKLEIEGPEYAVDQMINWCWDGPPMSRVRDVTTIKSDLSGFTEFTVR